ncbi:TetR/AcrR family transcriptional regulator [Nocardia sp. NPDC003963]
MRDVQKEITRSRLMDAAIACFVNNGYRSTSIADITNEAGATRATFYLHYKSKVSIVTAILDDLDRLYQDTFDELPAVVVDATPEAVRRWLGVTVGVWESTRELSVVVAEAAAIEPEIADRRAERFDFQTERIAQALMATGKWSPEQAQIRGMLTFSQLENLFAQWSGRYSKLDLHEAIEVLVAMWVAALEGSGRPI